jgi:hypothetical protein
MKHSPRPCKTVNLSDSLHRQLNMYALAAGAAGVGTLALAQSAEAKIVYTPAHQTLPINKPFYLDLNHDGKNDFQFNLGSHARDDFLRVRGLNQKGNGIWWVTTSRSSNCAAALNKGMTVGPKAPFRPSYLWMFFYGSSFGGAGSACPWLRQNQTYLGLRFIVRGKVHFGWARFTTREGFPPSAELTGYAYETIPGKAIRTGATKGPDDIEPTTSLHTRTPEPATLGLLALGAPGLAIWRREEESQV